MENGFSPPERGALEHLPGKTSRDQGVRLFFGLPLWSGFVNAVCADTKDLQDALAGCAHW